MASVPFIPRSVKRKSVPGQVSAQKNHASTSSSVSAPCPPAKPARPSAALTRVSADDIRIMFSMALSSYSLYTEPELRRILDGGKFVLLSTVLRTSSILGQLLDDVPEAQIVSALRETPDTSRPELRIGKSGFEIRWDKPRLELSFADWERRTVYIENIPARARTMTSVHHSLSALLDSSAAGTSSMPNEASIQRISFPPGHASRYEGGDRYRGFAFVVLSTPQSADKLAKAWPWQRSSPRDRIDGKHMLEDDGSNNEEDGSTEDDSGEDVSMDVQHRKRKGDTPGELARRAGARVVLKSDWLKLKDEYLVEQTRLLELSRPPVSSRPPIDVARPMQESAPPPRAPVQATLKRPPPASEPGWYPVGCLVFARSLPESTNRTALKALFSTPLGNESGEGVDYVDWTKGMDTCHVRFSSADDASNVIAYFRQGSGEGKAGMDVELVDGERERLYWERVPEHVRLEALRRGSGPVGGVEDEEDRRPKKRRR